MSARHEGARTRVAPERASPAPVPLRRLVLTLAPLAALAPFSTDMYLPGFTQMARDFATDAGHIEATLSVFFIGMTVGQALYGPLIDRFGRRRPLLFGLALYTFATLLCLLSSGIQHFVALRALQAAGGCGGVIIGRAVVRDRFPDHEIARILSLLMMIVVLAPVLAPTVGSWMVALYSWRLIFVFLLLFGMVCMALAWFNLPESLPPERRQSLHLGHVLKVYARLLLHPPFIVPGAVGGLASSGLFAYITGSAFVFIQHLGLSTQRYGALFGLVALGLIASAQLNRLALRHWTPARILGWGLTANVVAGAALLLVAGHGGLIAILIPLWLAICTLGFVGPNAAAGAMIASGEHAGSGSALIGVLQFSCASAASGAVAGMQNGTAYPMAIVIAVAGLSGALLWWLCGRSEGLRRPPLQHRA